MELFTKRFDDENYPSPTSLAELSNEESVLKWLNPDCKLLIEPHINFVKQIYSKHSSAGIKQETFSIWSPTYVLFVLRVLGYDKDHSDEFSEICEKTRLYMERRKAFRGGISGLTYDNPHLVSNYSAIMTLALIGTDSAYEVIDRAAMYEALLALKYEDGSFRTTLGMEHDIRATYTALLIADTLNILTPELTKDVDKYVLSCARYDGGFGPNPGIESHGGYVHTAVGIMKILGLLDQLDLNSLIRWISMRQMEFSGGFNGRTNKLVDSCYSWWVGSAARAISDHLHIPPFWNEEGITQYTLKSAQVLSGGFKDHAPSSEDPFHTFYGLAGLCVAGYLKDHNTQLLPQVDTLFCVPNDLAKRMRDYFKARPFNPTKKE